MNADQLLAHYEQIADAPDAIARLRRFILDLAVRGKLVDQNPNDEPAAELLKRIAGSAAHQPARRGKQRDTSAANALEELPFDSPSGWSFAALWQLVRVLNGRAYKQQELLSSGTPVLRVGNLFTSNHWYYSDLKLDDDKYCEAGDLIYAWSASFGPFIWDGPRSIFHYHIWKLPLTSEADLSKRYLFLFLQQKTREIKEAGHGISMVHMTKEKMEKLIVPLPPLAEQHRIVAKVDELMALCDQLEAARAEREATRDRLAAASLARLGAPDPDTATFQTHAAFALKNLAPLTTRPDQIKQLRQTILNLAVRGKLVEQNPADEPAAELLKRIAVEKAAMKGRKGARTRNEAASIAPSGMALPHRWESVRLDAISTFENGDRSSNYPSGPDIKSEGIPFFSTKNLSDHRLGFTDLDFISPEKFGSLRSGKLKDLDILITLRGSVGKFGLFKASEHITTGFINAQLLIIRCLDPEIVPYLVTCMQSDDFEQQIALLSSGAATPQLSAGKLAEAMIPLPPLAEQHRIVVKVDALMALCNRLEASLTTTDTTRQRLLEALLHEALTPGDDQEAAA